MNFMSKFEEMSKQIEKSKQGDSYDRSRMLNDEGAMGNIMNRYQQKIDRQNSRVITDKNKFEVNSELREFETA